MNPFFFGSSKSPLYGVYHQADNARSTHGVVLCPPLGNEYMRSHRAMRQLATMLSRTGIPVLRFDYHGTGDSHGDLTDATSDQWLKDIELAIDELKDTANVTSVSVVGLRLGGLIAAHACHKRDDVTRLILWDPVISGVAYLKELNVEIQDQSGRKKRSNFVAADGTIHFNGFALSTVLQEGLKQLSLKDCFPASVQSVHQIVSSEAETSSALRDNWEQHPGFEYHYIDAPGDWNHVDANGGILLPQPIIQGILELYNNREAA